MTFGLVVAMSLFAAPLAACVCSHHEPLQPVDVASCDHHAESSVETAVESAATGDDSSQTAFAPDGECVCIQPSVKALVKSDTGKFQKDSVTTPLQSAEPIAAFSIAAAPALATRSRVQALDDPESFTPSRGPPRA